jgi:hypothetical protein
VADRRLQFSKDDAQAVSAVTDAVRKQHLVRGTAGAAGAGAPRELGRDLGLELGLELGEAAVALDLVHGQHAEYRQPLTPHVRTSARTIPLTSPNPNYPYPYPYP